MKKSYKALAAALMLALMPACQQMQIAGTETIPDAEVILAKKNYRVVATQVSGEDKGFALLPGLQAFSHVAALAPYMNMSLPTGILIKAPSDAKALDNLYKASGAVHTGRATQLINVRKEYGGFNAIIFGRPKIRYTADLIEFGAAAPAPAPAAAEAPDAAPKAKVAPKVKKRRGRRR